ncbi:hypothetical protein M0802_013315 [Mischocyttarus mexicanus]|nr:hypothetical protein M0802_013315 [Mischocyttarus mexicanus]
MMVLGGNTVCVSEASGTTIGKDKKNLVSCDADVAAAAATPGAGAGAGAGGASGGASGGDGGGEEEATRGGVLGAI